MDAAFLNSVANHPDVRPRLGRGLDVVDFTAALQNPDLIALVGDVGGFLALKTAPHTYDVHTIFPVGALASALQSARDGLDTMFSEYNAETLTTMVPMNNRPAALLARTVGFKRTRVEAGGWTDPDGSIHAMAHYELTKVAWEMRHQCQH